MRVPSSLDSHVRIFCREIVPKGKPFYIVVQPLPNKPANECFSIVPEHIAANGGKQLIGWSIWEWKKVLIEAEFHVVWQKPDGIILDITPKADIVGNPFNIKKILFLPDPSREYKGILVDNIRKPLRDDPRIGRFCNLLQSRFSELNKGNLANYYGEITDSELETRIGETDYEAAQLEQELIRAYGKR